MALDEKYTKGPFYLWTPLRNGGETKVIPDALGHDRTVITSRNVHELGKKVTQKDLEADDALWMEWVDGGVVRTYEYPEVGANESPLDALRRKVVEAATSEEERLSAQVLGLSSDAVLADEALVAEKAKS